MDTSSLKNRSATLASRTPARLFALSTFPSLSIYGRTAEGEIKHSFIEQRGIKSETLLTCHPEKKQGKSVHTAVGMGCENSHQAVSENGTTTITPVAPGGELCAMCHGPKKAPVMHDPHASKAEHLLHNVAEPRDGAVTKDSRQSAVHSRQDPFVEGRR